MTQTILFAESADVCERKHGGVTESIAAFHAGDKGADREQVFEAVKASGERGLTLDELSAAWNRPPNALSARFCELREAGRIYKTVETRKTRSGVGARVYRVTE